jgi:lipid-A-disaccharide synthase-like uncharacterized protein
MPVRWIFIVAALFTTVRLIMTLRSGDADMGIHRETRPFLYWLAVVLGTALALMFFYFAVFPFEV